MRLREYWQTLALAALSIAFAALQLQSFERLHRVDYVQVVSEGIQVLIVFGGLVISQKLRGSPPYLPVMAGLSLYYFYAVTDLLDEFLIQPRYFSNIFEDVLQTGGLLLLLYGGISWVRLRAETERELRRSNQLKELFLDILRHDLLNPTGSIRSAAELLLQEFPDREELRIIVKSANKLVSIIESAARLAKLQAVQEIKREELDLREVVERAVEQTRAQFERAGMEVENRIEKPLIVNANPVIEEVFVNLLSNAAKYASDGKRVEIYATEQEESVTVCIRDFGPGVPDEDKEEIFRRFERRDKRGVRGIGLGLAIVKRIVELHRGEVWVEDNTPRGAVFCVSLPRR